MEQIIPGITTTQAGVYLTRFWWLILVVQLGLTVGYLLTARRAKAKRWYLVPLGLAAGSQLVHFRLGCINAGLWCNRYIWLNLGVLLLAVVVKSFKAKK